MLRKGWSAKTASNCRSYLLGGRFRGYLEEQGVRYLDQLMGEHAGLHRALPGPRRQPGHDRQDALVPAHPREVLRGHSGVSEWSRWR
jgi:hypothetical protein